MRAGEVPTCADCGSAHLGRCGGLPFAMRLRSVKLDPSAVPTRERRNYFDESALTESLGESSADRVERIFDETDGIGPVSTGADGAAYHTDRKTGERTRLDDRAFDRTFLAAPNDVA